jgi:hypothetical protein
LPGFAGFEGRIMFKMATSLHTCSISPHHGGDRSTPSMTWNNQKLKI